MEKGILGEIDADIALRMYEEGAKEHGCHACYHKLMQNCLESTSTNKNQPKMDYK